MERVGRLDHECAKGREGTKHEDHEGGGCSKGGSPPFVLDGMVLFVKSRTARQRDALLRWVLARTVGAGGGLGASDVGGWSRSA